MLVQSSKSKLSRHGLVSQMSVVSEGGSSSSKESIEKPSTTQQQSSVDEKYRTFHRRRRSEQVSKYISSLIQDADRSKRAKSIDEGDLRKTDFEKYLQNLQKENHELKKELSSVQSLHTKHSSSSHHSLRQNSFHGSHHSSHHSSQHSTHPDSWQGNNDTYNGLRQTFSGSINSFNTSSQRWRAKQKYDDAVIKYRLEIYKNRSENPRASPFFDESEAERIKSLEAAIFRLKLENLRERTEKEKIRLELDHLQSCFEALTTQYHKMNRKTQNTVEHYDQRLQDAFDRLHNLQFKKKSKIFFWRNSKANITGDAEEKFISKKMMYVM